MRGFEKMKVNGPGIEKLARKKFQAIGATSMATRTNKKASCSYQIFSAVKSKIAMHSKYLSTWHDKVKTGLCVCLCMCACMQACVHACASACVCISELI